MKNFIVNLAAFVLSGVCSLLGNTNYPGISKAAFLDPADLTFNGKEARSFAEVVIEEIVEAPELSQFVTVIEDIVADEQIAYLGKLDKVTKAYTSCGAGQLTVDIPASEKFWNPKKVLIWLAECLDGLEDSFMVYLKNKGVDAQDFSGTDIMDFLVERTTGGSKRDTHRIVWFNDTAHANTDDSPPGVITSGVSLGDYNLIDGFWSQFYDIVAADSARRVTVSRNGQATYALQGFDSTDTTNRVASGIFRDLAQKADTRLRAKSDKIILCTRSLADQYENELESEGVDASFEMIMDGVGLLRRKGIQIFALDVWDDMIRADQDNGTKYNQPHRAVLTTKANLMVGVDASSSLSKWKVFFDDVTDKNHIKGSYKIDAKVREDHMIQVAY